MNKQRLDAFSDGVIAILITIMVLELRSPGGPDLAALAVLAPTLCSYVLSFVYLGIYWNSHHHMLQATRRVTGGIMWANLHLLFWLSLVPFITTWVGQYSTAAVPTSVYGVVLLLAGASYKLLQTMIIRDEGPGSPLARAVGRDVKGMLSLLLYAAGIALAFVHAWLADALYVAVALMWLVPDRRIEKTIAPHGRESGPI